MRLNGRLKWFRVYWNLGSDLREALRKPLQRMGAGKWHVADCLIRGVSLGEALSSA